MADFTNEMTFVLFQNDKGGNPKRPDWRGKVFIGGEEYRLSGWKTTKRDGTGEEYIRGKVEKIDPNAPKYEPRQTSTPMPTPPRRAEEAATEDIPF